MEDPRLADRRRRVRQRRGRVGPPSEDTRRAGPGALNPRVGVIPLPDVSGYLLPKEHILYMDRRHPALLVKPALIAFGVFVVASMFVTASGAGAMLNLFVLILLGLVVWLVAQIVRWSRTVLVVSDRRVFEFRHLVMARAAVRPVFRQSVKFHQGPVGERLNYGTILTESPTGDRVNTFEWIHNPKAFYQAVTDKAV